MKKIVLVAVMMLSVLMLKSFADEKLIEINNKICPISHEPIGKDGMKPVKIVHNGKVYNLCCTMCKKDFMKDIDKYSKMLDEEAAKESVKM